VQRRPRPDEAALTDASYLILLALAAGERHGYAILQEVEALSAHRTKLGPGTLYRTLQRLVDAGWIEEVAAKPRSEPAAARRRYYRIAATGLRVARAETARLERMVAAAHARPRLARAPGPGLRTGPLELPG
jgi:DNA-binding PadR family transcriptional regulator